MNLINNAHDAMENVDNPRITIKLASFQPDDAFMKKKPYFKADKQYAHLSIEDNGCGISKKDREHIFEPFYTTKEEGKGTGLGLAMVYGAVKTHSGFIEVDSKKGKGATFHLFLPLIPKLETLPEPEVRKDITVGHGEVILLADDEEYVRETSAEVLEDIGYKVLQACNGAEALDIFEACKEDISLAILDVIMPRVGGVQLANRIRETNPDMPVIFVTGYDKDNVFNDRAIIPNSEILKKPVQFEALSHSIRKLLD
ncbi:MAG: response regulator, partial [Mariprofundaceae bacterium]|nr:response regulator [Mariprofundaceae bacterium]